MNRIAGIAAALLCAGLTFADLKKVRVLQTIDSETGQRFITAVTEEPTQCALTFINGSQAAILLEQDRDSIFHRFDVTGWTTPTIRFLHDYALSCLSRGETEFESKSGTVRTSLTSSENVRAVFISDPQRNPEEIESVRNTIELFRPQVVLAAGDIVQEGDKLDEWLPFLDAYPFLKDIPFVSAFGDHEFKPFPETLEEDLYWLYDQYMKGHQKMTRGEMAARLLKPSALSSNLFYGAVRLGPLEIYLLDSVLPAHAGGSTILEARWVPYLMDQVKWFKNRLSESQNIPNIHFRIAIHHVPPFGSNDIAASPIPFRSGQERYRITPEGLMVSGFDTAARAYLYAGQKTRVETNTTSDDYIFRYFVPLFEQFNVRLDLNGHLHRFERLSLHGHAYLTAGPAGGRFMEEAQYGTNSDSARNFESHVKFLLPRWSPSIFTAEDIANYSEITVEVPPLMERTVTFLTGSQTELRVYTCSFKGNVVDDFVIPVGKEAIRNGSVGGVCHPPEN